MPPAESARMNGSEPNSKFQSPIPCLAVRVPPGDCLAWSRGRMSDGALLSGLYAAPNACTGLVILSLNGVAGVRELRRILGERPINHLAFRAAHPRVKAWGLERGCAIRHTEPDGKVRMAAGPVELGRWIVTRHRL